MAIYGTALLAGCLICGLAIGQLIGLAMGIEKNVGGVGIAMLLLIVISGKLQAMGRLPKPTQNGVLFWSSIYIPVVVAMAAKQNVVAAIEGGATALVAGTLAVVAGFALVPLISRIGKPMAPDWGNDSKVESNDNRGGR